MKLFYNLSPFFCRKKLMYDTTNLQNAPIESIAAKVTLFGADPRQILAGYLESNPELGINPRIATCYVDFAYVGDVIDRAGGNACGALLEWLSTLTQEQADEMHVTRPEPYPAGTYGPPRPREVIKTIDELVAISQAAGRNSRLGEAHWKPRTNLSPILARRNPANVGWQVERITTSMANQRSEGNRDRSTGQTRAQAAGQKELPRLKKCKLALSAARFTSASKNSPTIETLRWHRACR